MFDPMAMYTMKQGLFDDLDVLDNFGDSAFNVPGKDFRDFDFESVAPREDAGFNDFYEDEFKSTRYDPAPFEPMSKWDALAQKLGSGSKKDSMGAKLGQSQSKSVAPKLPNPMQTLANLMTVAGKGGQQPYQNFMPQQQNPWLQGLMNY